MKSYIAKYEDSKIRDSEKIFYLYDYNQWNSNKASLKKKGFYWKPNKLIIGNKKYSFNYCFRNRIN
jgi:hypothetical protein